jgi:hypothetical protein
LRARLKAKLKRKKCATFAASSSESAYSPDPTGPWILSRSDLLQPGGADVNLEPSSWSKQGFKTSFHEITSQPFGKENRNGHGAEMKRKKTAAVISLQAEVNQGFDERGKESGFEVEKDFERHADAANGVHKDDPDQDSVTENSSPHQN